MFTDTKNRPLSRLFAQLFDLSLFFFILATLAIFFLPDFFQIGLLLIVPLLWIPIESILLTTFGATLGQKLFGLRIRRISGEILSPQKAFKNSLYLWDHTTKIIYRKNTLSTRAAQALSIFLIATTFTIGYTFRDLWISSEEDIFQEKLVGDLTWYTHKDKKYALEFPKEPTRISTDIPIPKSSETLHFEELRSDTSDMGFSLSYLNLPKRWLKWGSGLVLKGSLKFLVSNIPGAKIIRTSKHKYNSFPSLEFEIAKSNGLESAGRLILIKDRLYKLEVTYPKAKRTEMRAALTHFIQSFRVGA
jgi:hypothetical protein